MKKKLFALLALVCMTLTASAGDVPTYSLTKASDAEAHGTITFKVGENTVTSAAEGETVTVIVTPAEGWATGKASGKWYAAAAAAPRRTDIDMLEDFELTPVEENDNAFSFVMERANAEISMTYKKLLTNPDITIGDIEPLGYTGEPLTPAVTVQDGSTVLVLDQDYTVEYSDNVLVGEATITINGIGDNYAGTTTKTFEIYGYAITVDPEIQHGTVEVQPFSVADALVTVKVTPEQGYKLKKLSPMVGKTVLQVDENLSFVMPAMAVHVTADFELTPTNFIVDVPAGDITAAINAETDNMQKEVTGVTVNLQNGVTYTVSEPVAVPGDIIINGNGAIIDASAVSKALVQLTTPADEVLSAPRRAPENAVEGYDYVGNVIIKDIVIKDVKNSIFYDNKMKVCVENFTIDNVVLDLATEGVDYESLVAFEGGCVKDFTIKNSTIYGNNAVAKYFVRCSNGADFAKAGYAEGTVTYENNTFYGLLKDGGQWGNNLRYNNNASKIVLAFNKNIFVDCADGNILRRLCNKNFDAFKEGSTMAMNTFLVNGAAVDQGSYGNQTDLLYTPYFKDAANGDFSVAKATEQYENETGDPRWIASAWNAGLYTITVKDVVNGQLMTPKTAMAEDVITIKIVPAEGYQLKSLKGYIGLAELIIEEDMTFNMPPADVVLTAEFEEIPITGVNEVIGVNGVKDNSFYDLNGRRLQGTPTQKGVYIMNGNKVVIK